MFFDTPEEIPRLAKNTGFSIFVIPREIEISNKKTIKTAKNQTISLNFQTTNIIELEEVNGKIRIDQIREVEDRVKSKSATDTFIIVKNAEHMNEAAENAFLKLLEEPKINYHYVFFTKSLSSLLQTIISRAEIYILKEARPLDQPLATDQKTIDLAKRLIAANFSELTKLSSELTDKKLHKNPREDAKQILETAVEILYKSYFKTKNPKFLKKLEKTIFCYENITKNGHLKLHLIADLC